MWHGFAFGHTGTEGARRRTSHPGHPRLGRRQRARVAARQLAAGAARRLQTLSACAKVVL